MSDDHADAARYATAAAQVLLELRARSRAQGVPPLGDAGDHGANECLLGLLAHDHPGDIVLSEEWTDDRRRLDADRVWIIDPLDGTREFTDLDRTDWAVHVALWRRDVGMCAGAVALPAQGRVFCTRPAPVVAPRDDGALRLVVSRTRPPPAAERAAQALGADLVPMGSAGAKAMAVVEGAVDAYVHAGGQYEWDSAAPSAVAAAAGLHVSRLDGSPLEYNQTDPWLPDIVICRPEVTAALLDALRS